MKSFAWILILLCVANFLATFARQDSEMLRSRDLLISSEEFSLVNMEKNHDYDHARKLTAAKEFTLTGKGQKGKGSYGGANVVHRKPGDKSDATSYGPCFFILSAVLLAFSFFS